MGPDRRWDTLGPLRRAPRGSGSVRGHTLPNMADRGLRHRVRGATAGHGFPGARPGQPGRPEAAPGNLISRISRANLQTTPPPREPARRGPDHHAVPTLLSPGPSGAGPKSAPPPKNPLERRLIDERHSLG